MNDPDAGRALTASEWRSLAAAGTTRRLRRGQVLFREGDASDTVCAVRSGSVRISVLTPTGRELVLAVKGPGELVGELSAIDGRSRSATATCLTPVEVVAVPATAFDAFIENHPRFAVHLLRVLAGQVREGGQRAVDRSSADTTTRVARRLVALADSHAEHGEPAQDAALALTQDDLAGWVGASREATSRSLAELRHAGWVTTGRARIVVEDLPALRERAR